MEWAAYESRINACSLIADDNVKEIKSLFFIATPTMEKHWWKLKELESNTYLKIITGQESIDLFDDYVQEWKDQGGTAISREVEETLNHNK